MCFTRQTATIAAPDCTYSVWAHAVSPIQLSKCAKRLTLCFPFRFLLHFRYGHLRNGAENAHTLSRLIESRGEDQQSRAKALVYLQF